MIENDKDVPSTVVAPTENFYYGSCSSGGIAASSESNDFPIRMLPSYADHSSDSLNYQANQSDNNITTACTQKCQRCQRTQRIANRMPFPPTSASCLPPTSLCRFCGARLFPYKSKGLCCSQGQVQLACNPPPQDLYRLMTSNDEDSQYFRANIRTYNNLFAFTSMGVLIARLQ